MLAGKNAQHVLPMRQNKHHVGQALSRLPFERAQVLHALVFEARLHGGVSRFCNAVGPLRRSVARIGPPSWSLCPRVLDMPSRKRQPCLLACADGPRGAVGRVLRPAKHLPACPKTPHCCGTAKQKAVRRTAPSRFRCSEPWPRTRREKTLFV